MVGKQNRYSIGKNSKNTYLTKLVALLLGVTIIGAGIFFFLNRSSQQSPIPEEIKQAVPFVIFYPAKSTNVMVDTTSFKFDKPSGLLSYTADYSGAALTFAEQATPENFIDIPESFTKLLETLNEYSTFDSFHDAVHLTKPKELKGQQSAIMNSKGTLIFANVTSGSLTDNEWKKLFNNLEVIR